MRNAFFVFIFCFFTSLSFAQKEASHWYFGNGAGLDFSKGAPVQDRSGQLFTNEGCAVISDKDGNLLFYTDGVEVYNSAHETMPNGTGLMGGSSSTQSAIILQKPGNVNVYYIFTVAELAGAGGLQYSVVDMRQDGGKGNVIVKNQKLLDAVSEKLTAVRHANGKAWWVVTHQWNSNSFYCYKFDEEGVSQMVVSAVGVVHKNLGSLNNSEAIGYIKSSPDGRRLASAMSYIPKNNVELFDFNNSTGTVSNVVNLPSPGNAYGVCFSPDNSKLYVSYESGDGGVVQYDLKAKDIPKSAFRLTPSDNSRYGAMQIGPDDKIYVSKLGTFLDFISYPNSSGSGCGYRLNGLNLNGVYSTFGLPDFFVLRHNRIKLNLGKDSVICAKSYVLDAQNPGASYLWSTGETSQSIIVSKTGLYTVKVNMDGFSVIDTIKLKFKKPLNLDLGKDTVVCGDILPLDAGNPGAQYLWSVGSSTQIYVATISGTYKVTVQDGMCYAADSIKVTFANSGPAFVPLKAFMPNNGGFNDRFDYILNGVVSFHIKITSPRGKLMFEAYDAKQRWEGMNEGQRVKKGNYKWEIEYKTKCAGNKVFKENGLVQVQ